MQTKALKTLVRIAEVGSFATAANQLNITLSALSMQMKTLETELDVSLFDRSFRPPKLTPMGRRIALQAQSVIQAENDLINACSPEDELSGTYRIGFIATASVRLLPLFLKNASKFASNAHFHLETGLSETLEEKVLSGQLEAAIVTASGDPDPSITYDLLREEELLYAIPFAYKDVPLKELISQLPFLQFNPSSGIGKVIAGHISQLSSRREQTIGLDSVEAIMECVNEGIGFTMLAHPDIERYAKQKIHLLKPKSNGIYRQLVLASSERGLSKKLRERLISLFEANTK